MTLIDKNYRIIEILLENSKILVYRAEQIVTYQQVIILLIRSDWVNFDRILLELDRYNSNQNLNLQGVIQLIEFKSYNNDCILVVENFDGIEIDNYFNDFKNRNNIDKFDDFLLDFLLPILIQISEAIVEIHKHHLIYQGINPSNIYINPKTYQIKFNIIDREIRTLLKIILLTIEDKQDGRSNDIFERSLAYVSPEQTQRLNRTIDYRSDFYSLGVTLYELLTDRLPFDFADSIELIHAHLTKSPTLAHNINPLIPTALSAIIDKLMAKNVKERYQSAVDLKLDLEYCWSQWQRSRKIENFELTQKISAEQFVISNIFYGRETELKLLLESCNRLILEENAATSDSGKLILISGFLGVGKSALIKEVEKIIIKQTAYSIAGKFLERDFHNIFKEENRRQDRIFNTLIQAFRGLIKQLLSEDNTRLTEYNNQILAALGNDGQIIIDVIPELAQLIDRQPSVNVLSERAERDRFNLVFHKFSKIIVTLVQPLIIFLEDLQWANDDSLDLLEVLMSDGQNLLVICTYRDSELSGFDPIKLTLDRLKKMGVIVREIFLSPLSKIHVDRLIADSFNCSVNSVRPLADLIYQKTNGNPFFVIKFLESLAENGSIEFDRQDRSWQCDLSKIKLQSLTNDEIELIADRLQQLPEAVRELLKLAACLGMKFDLSTLAISCQQSELAVAKILCLALDAGAIVPTTETYNFCESIAEMTKIDRAILYQLSHDRVRAAAYSLIPAAERAIVHQRIGELFIENIAAVTIDWQQLNSDSGSIELTPQLAKILHQIDLNIDRDRLFMAVDLLNYAVKLDRIFHRKFLMQLNWIASRKAKTIQTYTVALKYARFGLKLLVLDGVNPRTISGRDGRWEMGDGREEYDLALTLYQLAIELAALCGEFDLMNQWIDLIVADFQTPLQLVNIYIIKIRSLTSQGFPAAAIEIGIWLLAQLGLQVPKSPTIADLDLMMLEIEDRQIESLFDLPRMTDPHPSAIVAVAASMMGACAVHNRQLYRLVAGLQVNLSIQYGYHPSAVYSYAVYGIAIATDRDRVTSGDRFNAWADKLAHQPPIHQISPETLAAMGLLLSHSNSHLRTTIPVFQAGYQAGLATAKLEYVGYHIEGLFAAAYWRGKKLSDLESQFLQYRQQLLDLHQVTTANYCEIYCETVLLLLGNPDGVNLKLVRGVDRPELLVNSQDLKQLFLLSFHRAMLNFLMGDIDRGNADALDARIYLDGVIDSIYEVRFYFYDSLIVLGKVTTAEDDLESDRSRVRSNQQQLAHRANSAPIDHLHQWQLVEAEIYRKSGNKAAAIEFYDLAIAGAQERDYIPEVALANELAAKFYLDWGKHRIAADYLRLAYYAYLQWGATAKIDDFKIRYPELLAAILPLDRPSGLAALNSNLDFQAYRQAIEALCDINLDRLLRTLMDVVIENTGADKAILLLHRHGKLTIEFEYDRGELETIDLAIDSFDPSETSYSQRVTSTAQTQPSCPLFLIRQVFRTQQIAIHDAIEDPIPINDPYFQHHQPQSILCVPIVNHSQSIGIIYLENSLIDGVFTRDRVELLNIICNQAAISLENSRLHQESQSHNQRLEISLNHLKAALHERQQAEQKLQATNEELMRSNRLKDEFLANMSHELRTPLNAILGMTDGLQSQIFGKIEPAQLTALNTIDRNSHQLLSLINGILDLAKISAGTYELNCAPTTIDSLCQSSWSAIEQQASQQQIQVTIAIQPNLPTLNIDERRICQALVNLLNNALKFTAAGGRVNLQATYVDTPDPHVSVAITDTGIGISPENINYLFQPFVQIDGSLSRKFEGTGLGLALAKRIVDLHDGKLDVSSELGVGSTFTMELPCQRSPIPSIPWKSPSIEPIAANLSNSQLDRLPLILVRSGDEATVNTISSYLKAKGYQIALASDDRAVMLLLEGDTQTATTPTIPDIILLDIQLPHKEELATIRQIRHCSNIPTIVLANLATTGDGEQFLAAGANAYLAKPVKLKQLATTIQQLLS